MPSPTKSHRPRLATFLAFAVLVLTAPAASASVTSLSATMDGQSFSVFSQINTLRGTLTQSSARAYSGTSSVRATYDGGAENGYARGIWNVQWEEGEDVWFGGAYYLPAGFHSNIQGQVDLMRWDNWSTNPSDTDWGGVSIYGSDHRARLLRFGAGRPNDTLVGPLDLPEGRWFTLEVHQRRSATAGGALSELYVDGKLVGKSTAPNTYGRAATRVRYGVVAIASGSQQKPLELYFDNASMGTSSYFGAGTAPAPAPEPAPEPAPAPAPETEPAPAPAPEAEPAPAPESSPTVPTTETKPKKRGRGRGATASLARPGASAGKRHRSRLCGKGAKRRQVGSRKRACRAR